MKGNKQKRLELKAKQEQHAEKFAQKRAIALQARLARDGIGHLAVNRENLAPDGSYDTPEFVTRGFYLNQPFTCIDCGKAEIWTEAQQKWWYEVAKGGVWTVAKRCRACRRRERERRTTAQRIQHEGLASKQLGIRKLGQLPKSSRNRKAG